MLPPLGSRERLWWALVLFGIAAGAAHLLRLPFLALVMMPFVLVFVGSGIQGYLWASLAGYMTFFEGFSKFSNAGALNIPDALLFAYILAAFARGGPNLVPRWPSTPFAWTIYAFAAYALVLSLPPFIEVTMADTWYYRDVKNALQYFLFIPLVLDKSFGLKSSYRFLLWICAFTAIHALICIGEFVATRERVITWNEMFFSDIVIISAVLLPVMREGSARWILKASLALGAGGLVVGQTRGLWLSTAGSLFLLYSLPIFRRKKPGEPSAAKALVAGAFFLFLLAAAFKIGADIDLGRFIKNRMTAVSPMELVDPNSSLGYRIHESLAVWEKKTWFGHGSGARLRLLFTQYGEPKIMDWWSIHSEYFEMLHKYGFLGLALFLLFHLVAARKSLRIWFNGKGYTRPLGAIAFLCLVNHAVVSITAGFLIREHVMGFIVLMLAITQKFDQIPRSGSAVKDNGRPAPNPGPVGFAPP